MYTVLHEFSGQSKKNALQMQNFHSSCIQHLLSGL